MKFDRQYSFENHVIQRNEAERSGAVFYKQLTHHASAMQHKYKNFKITQSKSTALIPITRAQKGK